MVQGRGRPRKFGGGYKIQNAYELFRSSEAEGRPDYELVALAIGACPAAPPPWAILACIEARQKEEKKSARGRDVDTPPILDALVRHFAYHQWEFERNHLPQSGPWPACQPPSFRSAVIQVAREDPKWKDNVVEGDDDWFKPIRRAWDWEQENAVLDESVWQLDGFQTTWRIDRVMQQTMAAEMDEPEDLHLALWLAKLQLASK